MSKVFTFAIIIVGLMLIFNLAGINETSSYVLTKLRIVDDPSDLARDDGSTDKNNANLYTTIKLILAAAAVVGIVVSFLTKVSPEYILIIPFVVILLAFVGDMIAIITYMKGICPIDSTCSWAYYIVLAVMGTLSVGYLISIISYWSNRQ